jgi:hypothetical protein
MTILIDRTVSSLSDIVGGSSKRGFPPLFSNTIIGVQPTTQPMGIYYALRYIYSGNNNQTPTFTNFSPSMLYPHVIKPFNLTEEEPKLPKPNIVKSTKFKVTNEKVRPKNWSANVGKNEFSKKFKCFKIK